VSPQAAMLFSARPGRPRHIRSKSPLRISPTRPARGSVCAPVRARECLRALGPLRRARNYAPEGLQGIGRGRREYFRVKAHGRVRA
jgi:hypothetical protein